MQRANIGPKKKEGAAVVGGLFSLSHKKFNFYCSTDDSQNSAAGQSKHENKVSAPALYFGSFWAAVNSI